MDTPQRTLADLLGDPETRTQTEQRIDEVLGLMQRGEWVTGVTHDLLSKQWGVSRKAVESYAHEATRIIRRYYRDDPEARTEYLARHCQSMERLAQKAESIESVKGYQVAIEAYRTLAQLQGVLKQQIDHQVDDHRLEFFRGWTREEKEHFIATGERPQRGPRHGPHGGGTEGGEDGGGDR